MIAPPTVMEYALLAVWGLIFVPIYWLTFRWLFHDAVYFHTLAVGGSIAGGMAVVFLWASAIGLIPPLHNTSRPGSFGPSILIDVARVSDASYFNLPASGHRWYGPINSPFVYPAVVAGIFFFLAAVLPRKEK